MYTQRQTIYRHIVSYLCTYIRRQDQSQIHDSLLSTTCTSSSHTLPPLLSMQDTRHTQRERYGDIRAPAIYEHTCHATKTPPIHHTLPLAPHHSSHTSTSPPPLTTPERFPNAPLHPDGSLRCRASLTGCPQLGESRKIRAVPGSGCSPRPCEGGGE